MVKELVISSSPHETKVAILEDDQLAEVYYERPLEHTIAGAIYKGRVKRVLPGMQSAFVDIGLERDAFLYVSDFFEDSEEYDKLVTGVEEKVARLEQEARQRKGTPAEAEAAVVPPAAVVEKTEKPEKAEKEGPAEAHAVQPAAETGAAEEHEQDRGRRRRSRRRRFRDRGFPESKYASRNEVAPHEAEHPAPERAAEPGEEEPIILPGESLAKYRRRQAQSEEPAAQPFAGETQPAAESPSLEQPTATQESAQQEPTEAEAAEELGGEVADALLETPVAEENERIEAAQALAEAEAVEPQPAAETKTAGGREPITKGEAPQPEASVSEQVTATEHVEESLAAESGPGPEEVSAEGTECAVEQTAERPAEGEEPVPEATGRAEMTAEQAEQQEEARAEQPQDTEEKEQEGKPSEQASVRGPAEPARFQQRMSRRMRRKMREQQQGGHAAPRPAERPEKTERAERTERPERAERGERERPPLPLISDLLREGQEIIVQIAKEPLGKKGARITSHVALPGRYVVYMPTVEHVGVSRKIGSDDERLRLKRLMQEMRRDIPGGFIVRTAAEGRSEEDLKRDIDFLHKLWIDMRHKAERRSAPALLHHDLNLVERILRDQLSQEYSAIWVDNEHEYEKVLEFVQHFQPALVSRVKLYTREAPIFEEFGIQDEINKALKPKVWLKSGGYIVINQTEALVAIDVNTGKYVGKTQRLEDTIVKTNVDAIKEIVRQIRLRDLGGIIVIDFIDMDERKNRTKVMQALEDALRSDRAPSKILQFNDFGLVAITRKRVKQSLERTLCAPCSQCGGSGFLKSPHTIAMEILAEATKLLPETRDRKEVTLRVNPDVARYLKQRDVTVLQEIEEIARRSVLIKSDPMLHAESFDFN